MPLSLIALALAAPTVQAQPVPPPPPPAGMQRPDPDRIVTRDQFLARAASRFDRIDTNRDGRIDRAEREAGRDRMRERRMQRRGAMPPPPAR